jgi:TetR/AcrR family transcriptional regulator, cholesterol catabolism regulator
MTASATKRANSAKRRPQILKKAANLFQAKGYAGVSMDELAAALKLNKATIYYHFPGGKRDLLYAINITALDELCARAAELSTNGSAGERLRAVMRVMADLEIALPDWVVVYHEESRWLKSALKPAQYEAVKKLEVQFRELVESIIADGLARKEFEELDPHKAALNIINMVSSSYRTMRPRAVVDAARMSNLQADLVLYGLAKRPGREGHGQQPS